MNKDELEFIREEGEGQFIEFKENVDKSLDKEITAFANAGSGRIFLGIDDKNKIKGIDITNKLMSQVQDIARNCDPSININLEEFENILILHVEDGKDKPYKCSSGFYLRQGPNSQKISRDEIIGFAIGEGKIKFDKSVTDINKYDPKLVLEYLDKAGIKQKTSENTLFNLGVANKEGFLNNTGILFFTKNPKNFLINAYITCARYKGTEKINN